ncbi:hypothetical protein TYRP_018818 [Tyrophagus putrescentiae]|nr:hypothetical protein TYRP_018818 [Tyrophagus putrescentiae]
METELSDANGNAISYFLYIQKFYEEYEQLQLEHSRLRQQLNDHAVLPKNDNQIVPTNENNNNNNNNRTADDLSTELDSEKKQNKSFKTEVGYLQEQVRKAQKRYNELLNVIKHDKDRQGDNDATIFEKKIEQQNLKISQLENENKELKESVEFITAENDVLTESLKDLEDTRFKERVEWLKEKENHEEALVYYRNLCNNSKENKQEIVELSAKLSELEETNEKLKQKYVRNRKVWEDNEKNLTNEIERIDSFIAVLVDTLKKLPESLKNCTELKEIITLIEQNEVDKSIRA